MRKMNINLLDFSFDVILSDKGLVAHVLLVLVGLTVESLDLGVVRVLLLFYFFEAFDNFLFLVEFVAFH